MHGATIKNVYSCYFCLNTWRNRTAPQDRNAIFARHCKINCRRTYCNSTGQTNAPFVFSVRSAVWNAKQHIFQCVSATAIKFKANTCLFVSLLSSSQQLCYHLIDIQDLSEHHSCWLTIRKVSVNDCVADLNLTGQHSQAVHLREAWFPSAVKPSHVSYGVTCLPLRLSRHHLGKMDRKYGAHALFQTRLNKRVARRAASVRC
jgi:hypothetical protein